MGLCDRFHCLPSQILDEEAGDTMRYVAIASYGRIDP